MDAERAISLMRFVGVLGEQSAKSLRAGQMQDVIFQGTDLRKAVNLCEVALIFHGVRRGAGNRLQ